LSQEQVPSLHIQHLPNRLRFTLQQKIARAAQIEYLNIESKRVTYDWHVCNQKNIKKAITFPRVGMQIYRRRLSEKYILKIQKKIKGSSN
jgi:hypothetical protein